MSTRVRFFEIINLSTNHSQTSKSIFAIESVMNDLNESLVRGNLNENHFSSAGIVNDKKLC